MSVAEKQCILCSQSPSRFPGLALVPVLPSSHTCLETETCLSATATPWPKLKQAAVACLHLQKCTGSKDLSDPLSIKHKVNAGVEEQQHASRRLQSQVTSLRDKMPGEI